MDMKYHSLKSVVSIKAKARFTKRPQTTFHRALNTEPKG